MASNTPKKNRIDQTAAEQNLLDGLNKHAQTIPSILIGGVTVPTKDIIANLQARIESAKTTQSTRATWQSAVKADKEERAKTKTTVSAVKQFLLVSFAAQIDALAEFGLSLRKQRVVTPEQKIAAAAKAKATREARHTMGSQQKKGVKGAVIGIAVTPVTAAQPIATTGGSPTAGATSPGATVATPGPAASPAPAPAKPAS